MPFAPEDLAFLREKGFTETAAEIERLIAENERLERLITALNRALFQQDTRLVNAD